MPKKTTFWLTMIISQDGRTVYAVDPKHGITVPDTRTGQAQGVIQGPAHSPGA
jgi:hypothetical protein